MGMGPKAPTESDLLIASQQPNVLRKNQNNVQVKLDFALLIVDTGDTAGSDSRSTSNSSESFH
jgi:hypothetical protein